MRWRRTASVAAILGVAAAGPALAAVPAAHNFNSRVGVTGLSYELIDLRPDDGIAPSVTFQSGVGNSFVELLYRGAFYNDSHSTALMPGGVLASRMLPGGAGVASIAQGSDGLGLLALGMGSRLGSKTGGTLTSYEASANAIGYGLNVLLSPGTEMRWTGGYSLQANADKWWGSMANQAARAELRIDHGGTFDTFSAVAYANPHLGRQSVSKAGEFSFSYVNTGTEAASYASGLTASTLGGYRNLGFESVPAVPEPSTYALMAAGLAVVGVVTRRRSAKAA
jgi:hypothetical protein